MQVLTVSSIQCTSMHFKTVLNLRKLKNRFILAPAFTTPPAAGGTVSIEESTSVGTSILALTATDSDGDGVSYSIDSQTPANAVALDGDGFTLNTALAFDFEGGTTTYTVTLVYVFFAKSALDSQARTSCSLSIVQY